MAIKVEQTRTDNRRLRNTLLLVLAGVVALPVAIFHARIFPHPSGPTSVATAMETPADQGPVQPAQWTLTVDGRVITVDIKSSVPTSFIHPGARADQPPDAYATLGRNKPDGRFFLINESSKDVWTVNGRSVAQGQEVPLGEEPVAITFVNAGNGTKAITGTIALVAAAGPPAQP